MTLAQIFASRVAGTLADRLHQMKLMSEPDAEKLIDELTPGIESALIAYAVACKTESRLPPPSTPHQRYVDFAGFGSAYDDEAEDDDE